MNDSTLHIVSKFYSYHVVLRSILFMLLCKIKRVNLIIHKYFFCLLVRVSVLFNRSIGLNKGLCVFLLGAIFLFSSSFLSPMKADSNLLYNNVFYMNDMSVIYKMLDKCSSCYFPKINSSFYSNNKIYFTYNFYGTYEDRFDHSSSSQPNTDKNLFFTAPMEILINTLAAGASGLEFSLPLRGRVNVSIDWGDGSTDSISADNLLNNVEHIYASHGEYIIKINGILDQFGAGASGYPNSNKIIEIISFGDLGITRLTGAFHNASNLKKVPNTIPTGIIDMSWMFYGARVFNSEIGAWDVRDVTDMSYMLSEASLFNQNIKNWNVEKVTNMERMFKNASSFNQSLENWRVTSVLNMTEFLSGVELSMVNYDNTLIGWSTLPLLSNILFDGGNSQYSLGLPSNARQKILDDFSWKITDAGPIPPDSVIFDISSTVFLNDSFPALASFFLNNSPYEFHYPISIKKGSGIGEVSGTLTSNASAGKVFFESLFINQLGIHTLELEVLYPNENTEKKKSFGASSDILVTSGYLGGAGRGDYAMLSKLLTLAGDLVYLWNGGVADDERNWFNANNWNLKSVPTSDSFVQVPIRPFFPVISGSPLENSIVRTGTTTLEEGTLLTVNSGANFSIRDSSNFITIGSTSKIVLEPNSNYLNLSTSTPNLEIKQQLNGSKGWRMLGTPLKSKTYNQLLLGLVPQGIGGTSSPFSSLQPNVLWFDETDGGSSLQGWRRPSHINNSVKLGRGHFVYVFNGATIPGSRDKYTDILPITLKMEGMEHNLLSEGPINFGITYTPRAATFQQPDPDKELFIESNPADAGFNMISNPTASVIDFYEESAWTKVNIDNSIYIWDPNLNTGGGAWRTFNGVVGNLDNGRIAPFQSFWVHANASNPQLLLNSNQAKTTLQKDFYSRINLETNSNENQQNQVLSLKVTSENLEAEAWISFDKNGLEGHDSKDAYQLESLSDNWLLLYSYGSQKLNTPLQINNLEALDETQKSIPLMIAAAKSSKEFDGDYVLSWNIPDSWPSNVTLVLMDHIQDKAIDMRKESFYQFAFKAPNSTSYRLNQANLDFKQLGQLVFVSPFATGEPSARIKKGNLDRRPFTIRVGAFEPEQNLEYLPDLPIIYSPYPNPYSSSFTVDFYIPYELNVQFKIINSSGVTVKDFGLKTFPEGTHQLDFEDNGNELSPGLYIIQMTTEKIFLTKKVIKKN